MAVASDCHPSGEGSCGTSDLGALAARRATCILGHVGPDGASSVRKATGLGDARKPPRCGRIAVAPYHFFEHCLVGERKVYRHADWNCDSVCSAGPILRDRVEQPESKV